MKNEIRVIRTARTEYAINEGAREGYFPLIKKIEPSNKIKTKYAVIQNKRSGEIRTSGDYRDYEFMTCSNNEGDFDVVIDFTFYYPHHFPSPFAAYLIPKDLKIGERVILEDLIEDIVSSLWNQGDAFRLQSCEAIWDGDDFELDYDLNIDSPTILG